MLTREMKIALAITGTACIPIFAQANQSMTAGQNSTPTPSSYAPGEKVKTGQLPGGYDQSATYVCANGWDIFITADYLYWKWQQDSFQIGTVVTEGTGDLAAFQGNSHAVYANPGYTSGFQVGAGFNMPGMDNWNLYSEYTWYKNSAHEDVSGSLENPIILPSSHFLATQSVLSSQTLAGPLDTELKLGFQALDFLVERPFYLGKKLTANFGMGLRAQWISQNFSESGHGFLGDSDLLSDHSYSVHMTSWGLGPKFVFDTNWLLGYGIKILGNIGASILYTQYNANASYYNVLNSVAASGSAEYLDNYGTLRPVTEFFLGLGWGSYFAKEKFHFDFSVGYDFDVYWDYNMLFYSIDQVIGNMYLQGMNIQVRFDF